eukprot:9841-Heterococcus_DN1.PRE.3
MSTAAAHICVHYVQCISNISLQQNRLSAEARHLLMRSSASGGMTSRSSGHAMLLLISASLQSGQALTPAQCEQCFPDRWSLLQSVLGITLSVSCSSNSSEGSRYRIQQVLLYTTKCTNYTEPHLDVALLRNEQVVRLQISVHNAVVVQELNC